MASTPRKSLSDNVEFTLRTIFRRCIQCQPGIPKCPSSCPDGQICSLVPQDCQTCAYMTCITNPSPAPSSPGPNIGAIAGGVVGGVLAVGVAVFLLWFFWIRKQRARQEMADWEDEIAQQTSRRMNDGASTRTRQSFANSMLSRASNIIQIAYIPGVTNRNGDSGHQSMLGVTPVPPIPAAFRDNTNGTNTPKSPLSRDGDALFFRPGDLRDSTYSTTSSFRSNNRDTQYTVHSITPSLARSSVASEIYRDDATTEPMPATTGMRLLPRVVSVKSTQQSIASSHSSPSPRESTGVRSVQVMIPGQGSATTTTVRGKATQVTVGAKSKEWAQTKQSNTPNAASPSESGEKDVATDLPIIKGAGAARGKESSPFTDAAASSPPRAAASPYKSMSSSVGMTAEERARRNNVNKLSAVIEEGVKHASRVPSHEGLGGQRDDYPFGDEHATN